MKRAVRDFDDFIDYLDAIPARLGVWRPSEDADASNLLSWINSRPTIAQHTLYGEIGPAALGITGSQYHNQAAIASAWTSVFHPTTTTTRAVQSQDREGLWNLAGKYWSLKNLVAEVRAGARQFELSGTRITMPYRGVHAIDALDRLLDTTDQMFRLTEKPATTSQAVRQWANTNAASTRWHETPEWVRQGMRRMAQSTIARLPRFLEMDEPIAGVTVAEIDSFWTELMAISMLAGLGIMRGATDPHIVTPRWTRTSLVESFAAGSEIDAGSSARLTEMLTMDTIRCPDPALTPLVPLGDDLILMSSLVLPASPHRNTVSIVQHSPEMFGRAGKLLGNAGENQLVETLGRMNDTTLVARRVLVKRPNGETAGDLDVVVCDPSEGQLISFEVSWRLPSDGNAESYKAAQLATDKRAQVRRLKTEIESDLAEPKWPASWPDVSAFDWRWYVLARDVIPNPQDDSQIVGLSSERLLRYTLRNDATVADLVTSLDNPPEPPEVFQETQWSRIRYGRLRIDVESLRA